MNQNAMSLAKIRDDLLGDRREELKVWMALSAAKRWQEVGTFAAIFLVGALATGWSQVLAGWAMWALGSLGVFMMGLAYNSLGLFLHEGLHGALANGRVRNRWASFAVGAPLLISATAYRLTHTLHHLELGHVRDYGTYRQHTRIRAVVWFCYYLQLTAGSLIYILCIPFLAWKHGRRGIRGRILLEYAVIGIGVGVVAVWVPGKLILLYWLLPVLVMNVLTNVRGLASHALGDQNDPLLASRSLRASPVVEWLLLYENYHLMHHLFPKVPSYHLRRVHDAVWPRLPRACWNASYLSFVFDFFLASLKGNLEPLGVVKPDEVK